MASRSLFPPRRYCLFKFTFAVTCLLAMGSQVYSQVWNKATGGGSWTDAANWTGGVPNGVDAIASFRFNITANSTITLNAPVTVGELILGDNSSTQIYTISGTNALTFQVSDPEGLAILRKEADGGNDVISAPIILESGLNVILNPNAARVISFNGLISGGVGATAPVSGTTAILFQSPTITATSNQVLLIGGPNNNTFAGQVIVESGTLRTEGDGTVTLLGAGGVGNETIIKNGGRIDLRNHDFNGSHVDGLTEIFHLEGSGWRGLGAMVNSSGTGTVSHIKLTGDTVIGGTGTIDMRGYTNTTTSQVVNPIFDGGGHTLTKLSTNGLNFYDTEFRDLNQIVIREGEIRLGGTSRFESGATVHMGQNKNAYLGATSVFDPLDFSQGSRSQNDANSTVAGTASVVETRLEFFAQDQITHNLNINMHGNAWIERGGSTTATADASYITTLTGVVNLVNGNTWQNGFNIGGGADGVITGVNTYVNPGRMVFSGQLDNTSAGNLGLGFTKRGNRELRIVSDQTKFDGDVMVTGYMTRGIQKTVNATTKDPESLYYNLALAEGGTLNQASNIYLEVGASLALLNAQDYHDRINDNGSIYLRNAFLQQITGTETNIENWGSIQSEYGANTIYFDTRAGGAAHNSFKNITVGDGSVLRFTSMQMNSTFGVNASDMVRLSIDDISTLDQIGNTAAGATTDRAIVRGMLGSTVPTTVFDPVHVAKNILEGAQAWAGSGLEFMTIENVGGVDYLRPLTNSEYSKTLGTGVNWHIDTELAVTSVINTVPNVTTDSRVNAIKFASNTVAPGSREYLYIDAGKKLTVDSGMLLVSHYGAATTGSFETVIRGAGGAGIDFNGQKAVVHAGATFYDTDTTSTAWNGWLPSNDVYIRTRMLNSTGLVKTGRAGLILEGANQFSGTSYVNDGILYLRHDEALKGSNQVVLNGDGQLYLDRGVNVKGTDLLIQEAYQARNLIYSNSAHHVTWGGDIVFDNVDSTGGMISKTHYLSGAAESTVTIYGDIYGTDIPMGLSDSDYFNDPRLLSITSSVDNANRVVVNLRGQFRDRATGALDMKSIQRGDVAGTQYDTNQLMRFQMRGNSDVNVNVFNQWDSSGQIDLTQGNFRVLYDPTSITDGFFSQAAVNGWFNTSTDKNISNLINSYYHRLSFSGSAASGTSVTAGTATYSSALFLTLDGQVMNNPNIYVYNGNRNGNITLGGENSSGTVYYGSKDSTGATQARIVFENQGGDRDLRFYQREGGTSVYNLRLLDNGTSVNSIVTKIGLGTSRLVDNVYGGSTIERWNLMGGVMQWQQTQVADDRFAVNAAQLLLGGGNLEYQLNTGLTANRAQTLGGALRILRGSSGVSVIRAAGSSTNSTTLTLGSTTVATRRDEGATVNFERIAAAGNAYIVVRGTSVNVILPWATHSTASGVVDDFAVVDGTNSNRVVGASSKSLYASTASDLDLSTWTATPKNWVSETAADGFQGTLTENAFANGIRFLKAETGGMNLEAGKILTLTQGAILNATSVGAFDKTIRGGSLTSSYKNNGAVERTELIVHQYNPNGALRIESNIVDSALNTPLSLVFTGTGSTILTGNNTHTGTNYLLGGKVVVDSDTRLGATSAGLYFAGGTLKATSSFELNSSRSFIIGGDGANVEVDGGAVLTYQGTIAGEANVVNTGNGFTAGITSNPYFGDFNKTGAGEFVLGGTTENPNFTGLITIKEGTFTIAPTLTGVDQLPNFLGTNSSAMDGVYVQSGGTLNLNVSQRWRTSEWITLNGMGAQGGGALKTSGVARDIYLNGQVNIESHSLLNISNGGSVLLNPGGGDLVGNGDIIRIGSGGLYFYGNASEYRGNLILGSGTTALRDDTGKLVAAQSFNLRRNALLNIEHQTVTGNAFSDRLNDDAPISMGGLSRLRMTADGVNQSGIEKVGDLNVRDGAVKIQVYTARVNNASGITPSPTYGGFEFKSINRSAGSVMKFSVNEVDGAFADQSFGSTVFKDVGVIAVKDTSSLEMVGGDGSRGTNRSVIVGAFGGNYVNMLSSTNATRDAEAYTGRHLMTMEQAIDPMTGLPLNVLRALRNDEYLKVATTNDAQITSTALGSQGIQVDDNVMLVGRPSSLADPLLSNLKTSFYTLDQNLTLNSLTFAANAVSKYNGTATSGTGERLQLYLGEGVTLKVQSGMLNFASVSVVDRDGGDQSSSVSILNQTQYLLGGKIDFDGREGIIHATSSWLHYNYTGEAKYGGLQATQSDVYINSSLTNMNGLTKAGERSVILSGINDYTGLTNVTEGLLYVRNSRALGQSPEVRLSGSGALVVQEGVQIKGVNLRIGEMTVGSRNALVFESGSSWGGDIIVDDVDLSGQAGIAGGVIQRNIIRASSAIGSVHGNIYGEHTNAILGIAGTTSKLVSTTGMSDGVLYLKGHFKDTKDGALAEKVTAANQNQALRFEVGSTGSIAYSETTLRSSEEGAVWIDNAWDSVGRFSVEAGNVHFMGEGKFWTDTAQQNMDDLNLMSGFHLGGDISSTTVTDQNVAFYFTKAGQEFNIGNIGIGLENDLGNRTGNSTLGALNQSGTVTFGLGTGSIFFDQSASTSYRRNLRLYQVAGGVSEIHFNFVDGGNLVEASLTKVGSGITQLHGSAAGASQLEGLYVMAGELQLTNYENHLNTRLGQNVQTSFGGGSLHHLGDAAFTENLGNVTMLAGGSKLAASGSGAFSINGTIARNQLSTMHFQTKDDGAIFASAYTATAKMGAFAVYGENSLGGRFADSWASVDASGKVVGYQHSVSEEDIFGTGLHTDVKTSGVVGQTTASLRFNTVGGSIASGTVLLEDGSILFTSNYEGGVAIQSGVTLGAAAGVSDLIFHNYAQQDVVIEGAIVANANLVFSGIGTTELKAAVSQVNKVALIDSAKLKIDDLAKLGADPATVVSDQLYFNGGELIYTGTAEQVIHKNRGILLGAEGGTIHVDQVGGRLVHTGSIRSEHNVIDTYKSTLGSNRTLESNPLAGNLTIKGAGVFQLGANQAGITAANYEGLRTNFYSGLTTIGDGLVKTSVQLRGHPENDIYVAPFGTHVGFEDGLLVKNQSELRYQFQRTTTYANPVRLLEWMQFGEKDTDTTYLYADTGRSIEVAGNVLVKGALNIHIQNTGVDPGNTGTNASMDFATNNTYGGQIMGDVNSRVIKTGTGTATFRDNNEHFRGEFEVRRGALYFYGYGDVAGVGQNITLGDKTYAAANVGDSILGLVQVTSNNANDLASEKEDLHLHQNIEVYGIAASAGSSPNTIRSFLYTDDSSAHYHGDIKIYTHYDSAKTGLNFNLMGGAAVNHAITGRYQHNWVFVNGDISGVGTGETSVIRVNVDDQTAAANSVLYGTTVFAGNNSAWKGEFRISPDNNTTIDEYERTIVRLHNNQALTDANMVSMYRYSTLQVAGSNVAIGHLNTTGGGVGVWKENGAALTDSSSTIENAAKGDGYLRIVQNTDVTWHSMFRDGKTPVYFDESVAPDGALHLNKDGTGRATLIQANSYSGTTTVTQGNLQVGIGAIDGTIAQAQTVGRTGTGATTVLANAILSGTGLVQGGAAVTHQINGGTLAPGDNGGNSFGTLFVNGKLQVTSNGTLQFQINNPHKYNAGVWSALLDQENPSYTSTLSLLAGDSALANPITSSQYDHLELTGELSLEAGSRVEITGTTATVNALQAGDVFNLIDWGTVSGARNHDLILPTLQAGLVWEKSLFDTHGILLVTVVPEPSKVILVCIALGSLMMRRRR